MQNVVLGALTHGITIRMFTRSTEKKTTDLSEGENSAIGHLPLPNSLYGSTSATCRFINNGQKILTDNTCMYI